VRYLGVGSDMSGNLMSMKDEQLMTERRQQEVVGVCGLKVERRECIDSHPSTLSSMAA